MVFLNLVNLLCSSPDTALHLWYRVFEQQKTCRSKIKWHSCFRFFFYLMFAFDNTISLVQTKIKLHYKLEIWFKFFIYTHQPLYLVHLFHCLVTQIANQPITWQQLNAFRISEECFQHLDESMPRRIKVLRQLRQKGVQPGTKAYLIKWPVSVYIFLYIMLTQVKIADNRRQTFSTNANRHETECFPYSSCWLTIDSLKV